MAFAAPFSSSQPGKHALGPERVSCTRYAAPGGSDSRRGTREKPFRTAQRLLRSLRSHEVGCLRGGTYVGHRATVLDFSRSNVSVVGFPGERAVLRGIVVNRSGANQDRLANVTIEGDGSQNTIQVYGADFRLEGSDITNAWRGRSCLMLGDPSAGTAVRPVIRGNRFHECGSKANGNLDHGIYASSVDSGLITENVFWNSAAYAIQLYPRAQNTVFSHNVIDGGGSTARGGIIVGGESASPSSGNTVEFNVISYAINYNIDSYWGGAAGSNNTIRSNCLYGAGRADIDNKGGLRLSGNVYRDPLFVNREAHDLRLRKSSGCRKTVRYHVIERGMAARAQK